MSSHVTDERLEPGVVATANRASSADGAVLLAPPRSHHISSRDALLRRMLALADLGAAVAVAAALAVPGGDVAKAFWALLFAPVFVLLAKLHTLYDCDSRTLRHVTVDEIPSISVWAVSVTATIGVLLMLTPTEPLTLGQAVYIWLTAASAAFCLRAFTRALWRQLTSPGAVLVVGEGPLADAVRRKLALFSDIHLNLVNRDQPVAVEAVGPGFLAGVERVIIASQSIDEATIAQLVSTCRAMSVKLSVIPPARGMFGTAVRLNHLSDLPILEYNTWDISQSTLLMKRAIDVLGSLFALVVLAPVFLAIAIAIRLDSPGPVFFSQLRAGLGGQPFRMVKFRTMVSDAEQRLYDLASPEDLRDPGFPFNFPCDPRITGIGRLLRRTSLDEIPQFVNVLKGEMSLVGPRPEQAIIVANYTEEHMFRLSVRPGITGPMQVSGRGDLTFDERLAIEREYVDNLSLRRDLRILALTVGEVLSGRGAV